MKRTFKDTVAAMAMGIVISAAGVILWAFPMPTLFPIEQNVVAGYIMIIGVLVMIFRDLK